jgi:hypothetical protein
MFTAEKRPRKEVEDKNETEVADNPSKYIKIGENASERVETTPSKTSDKVDNVSSSSKVNESPLSISFVPNGKSPGLLK